MHVPKGFLKYCLGLLLGAFIAAMICSLAYSDPFTSKDGSGGPYILNVALLLIGLGGVLLCSGLIREDDE